MNLDHLNYFKTLVELRSRSATAEKLSITPSTLWESSSRRLAFL